MIEGHRILVVDDDPQIRKTLSDILAKKGFAVEAAGDGRSALETVGEAKPAVALIDLKLGDMPGIELLKQLKGLSPSTAYIVLTGYASKDTAIEAINLGAFNYLQKPYEVEHLLHIIRQAIEKQAVDAALGKSEERFRSVAETAANGMVLVDGDGVIQYWNQAAEEIFGYSREEALGRSIDLLLPADNLEARSQVRAGMKKSREGSDVREAAKLTGVRKDGAEFPMELTVTSWESGGEAFYTGMIRDMTDVQEVQRRAQLQDRLAAVGQLAAGIAHDFNNILGAIILYSERLLDQPHHTTADRERLDTILKQAKRGAKLTSQVLDFSRRSVMEMYPMDLVPFLEEVENLLDRALPESIRVELSHKDKPFVLKADPARIEQVILNLVFNARDAMPAGGVLRIDLAHVKVGSDQTPPFQDMATGEWIRMRVSDTGSGIPPDALAHIFEPFFTTKPPGEGTGLGLAQVYGIIRQHQGYITASSEQDVGSTFTIYLPATDEPPIASVQREKAGAILGGGETILVVEDDESTRAAIGETLQALNYRVLHASNGKEALGICERRGSEIDLILSDVVMPDMGGWDLFHALKARRPEARLALMTGYPLGSETRELLDQQQVTWLHKPFTTENVARAVRRAMALKV